MVQMVIAAMIFNLRAMIHEVRPHFVAAPVIDGAGRVIQ